MQKNLNGEYIDQYCEDFASKITNTFFNEEKTVITGKEILTVTPSKQVNFFIIKLLFRYWQEETKKLKSPFFNYKNEEVRKAMVQFMNVLSQHIEIQEEQFKNLLANSVRDTIYLICMPDAYLQLDLEGRRIEKIKDKVVEGTVKYLKIFKKEIHQFLSDMKGLTVDEVIDELQEEFFDFDTNEEMENEFKLLSEVLEIEKEKLFADEDELGFFDEDDLLEPGEEDLIEDAPSKERPSKTIITEPQYIEENAPEQEITEEQPAGSLDLTAYKEEPDRSSDLSEEIEEEEEPAGSLDFSDLPEEVSIEEEEKSEHEPAGSLDLNAHKEEALEPVEEVPEKEEVSRPVIGQQVEPEIEQEALAAIEEEEVAEEVEETLEEVVEEKENPLGKIENSDLFNSMTPNHQFMFVKELFHDKNEEFETAILELEQFEDFDTSVEFLVQGYARNNGWDMQSDAVKEFLKVLFRKHRN